MPPWRKGQEVIEDLLADRLLERVVADGDTTEALLAMCDRHIASAAGVCEHDPEGALCLAYDAARKAATALLAQQGLRPTTKGGHIVVVDATEAQFPGVPGLRSLDRLRRRRNQGEYPDPRSYDPITADDARDAVASATLAVASARQILSAADIAVF